MVEQAKIVKVLGPLKVDVEYQGTKYKGRRLRFKLKKVGKAYKVDYPYVKINKRNIKVQKTW